MAVKKKPRGKGKDPKKLKPRKKKVSPLVKESIEYVDYKDVTLLRAFMSDRSKIRARRVTGNDVQQQREVADAIKVAREMALIPYATRVTTQRSNRGDRGDRGDRGGRADGAPPRPQGPPPGAEDEAAEEIVSNEEAVAEVAGVTINAADEGSE